jgi:hypothetical protein
VSKNVVSKPVSQLTDEEIANLSNEEINKLLAQANNNAATNNAAANSNLERGVVPEQSGGGVTFNRGKNKIFVSLQSGGSKRKNFKKNDKTKVKSQNLEMKLEKVKDKKRTLRKSFRGKYDKISEKPKNKIYKSATSDESLFFQEPLVKRQTQSGGGINKMQNKSLFDILFG